MRPVPTEMSSPQDASAPREDILVHLTPNVVRVLLLAYGLAISLFAIQSMDASIPDAPTLLGTRHDGIQASIDVVRRGGPPLLGSREGWGTSSIEPQRDYYRVGHADNPGIYAVLPALGKLAGVDDALLILKWFFLGSMAVVVLLYPLLFYELLGLVAGLLSPLVLLWKFPFLEDTGTYWVPGWCLLLCLPLLAVVHRRWEELTTARAVPLLAVIVLVGSYASSMRIGAGLPILLGALVVMTLRLRAWRHRLAVGAVLAIAYVAISSFAFSALREARDRSITVEFAPVAVTPWHSIYLGFGYLENNPYGITYEDEVADRAVKRVDPTVEYIGPGYGKILRGLVLDIVRENPGFVATTVALKLGRVLNDGADMVGWSIALLVPLLAVGRRRTAIRLLAALIGLALAVHLLPPVLVMPYQEYELAWLAAAAMLWLIAVLGAVGALVDLGRGLARRRHHARREQSRRRITAASAGRAVRSPLTWLGVTIAIVVLVVRVGPFARKLDRLEAENFWRQGDAERVQTREVGDPVKEWDFSGSALSEWSIRDVRTERDPPGGVKVTTSKTMFEYQLVSPRNTLTPGAYLAVIRGHVITGGLELGVLDARTNTWIATAHFWDDQPQIVGRLMAVPFTLSARTGINVILSNWAPKPAVSEWRIAQVEVVRVREGST